MNPITEQKKISFVGDNDLAQWLRQQAKREDRSVSAVIRRILDNARREAQQQRQPAAN